jgi:thiamine biosynthesis lipoprotein ApbE
LTTAWGRCRSGYADDAGFGAPVRLGRPDFAALVAEAARLEQRSGAIDAGVRPLVVWTAGPEALHRSVLRAVNDCNALRPARHRIHIERKAWEL